MGIGGFILRCSAVAAAFAVSGCIATTRNPERLYPLLVEIDVIRSVDTRLYEKYYSATPAEAKGIRNEIIAQRMYAIDLQYTEYETALTRESQEIGFAALTSAGTLTTASTLVASAATKSILSGVATAVIGAKSHYESEVLLAQTIRTIQKQMRASRNAIATNVSAKIVQDVNSYPLPAALSDVEDYYNAGTLTTGVIDTSTTVGLQELASKNLKQEVTQAPPAARAEILRSAVIVDATAPIAKPTTLQPVNSEGRTDFEKKLLPARIRILEIMTCQPKLGQLTDALRTASLAKAKRPTATALNNTDVTRIENQFFDLINSKKPITCP